MYTFQGENVTLYDLIGGDEQSANWSSVQIAQ